MRIAAIRRPERERIISDPGSCLRSKRFRMERIPFNPHHHPEIELTLIERGSGVRSVGMASEAYGPGDVVLVGGDVPHTWSSPAGQPGGAQSVVIQFPAGLLGDVPEARRLDEILVRARLGLAGPPAAAALVTAIHDAVDPLQRLARLLEAVAAAAAWRGISPTPPRRRRRDPGWSGPSPGCISTPPNRLRWGPWQPGWRWPLPPCRAASARPMAWGRSSIWPACG